LVDQWQSYLSFVISFYVVSSYWSSHRRAMRSVVMLPAGLIGSTLTLLLLVAAVPFPASVLGNYGREPSALVFYSAFNIAAHIALLRLLARIPGDAVTAQQREALWAKPVEFVDELVASGTESRSRAHHHHDPHCLRPRLTRHSDEAENLASRKPCVAGASARPRCAASRPGSSRS
jgi:hypothetical protein